LKTPALKYAITCGAVLLAVAAAFAMAQRYASRPWTRDAQVRANVVGIAPRVAGPIINIPVKDNQAVRKGDLLFEIDPATFKAALDNASARVGEAQAALTQATQELARQTQLYAQKVNDVRDLQNAQDSAASAKAEVAAARAELETAQLNLQYTKVYAPVNGYLTNMHTSPGTYVHEGEQLLALVDSDSFWVAAYFKETQIPHLAAGDTVAITLMGHRGQAFEGEIESIGWGVFLSDGAAGGNLLPEVSQTIDWVRLPQRFPVRVRVNGTAPIPLRIGQTASVAVRGRR